MYRNMVWCSAVWFNLNLRIIRALTRTSYANATVAHEECMKADSVQVTQCRVAGRFRPLHAPATSCVAWLHNPRVELDRRCAHGGASTVYRAAHYRALESEELVEALAGYRLGSGFYQFFHQAHGDIIRLFKRHLCNQ